MSKLLRTVSFASASLKTLALAIVLVLCGANTVFAQLPSLVCPDAADVNCNQDLPMATFADLEGSGYTASIAFSDAVVSGSGCEVRIARTYTATFTSTDDSYTNVCTVVHRVADFEAPVFVGAPSNSTYECIDEVPGVASFTAQDECGGPMDVVLYEDASSIDDTLVCNNITAPDAPGNIANYSLWLDGINAVGLPVRYNWSGSPSLVFSSNGEARLVGDVYATNGSGYGWHVDITLADGVNWADWSAGGGMPHMPPAGNLHFDWSFYKLVAVISRLEGLGALAGSQLLLTHKPANYSMGFQFGQGATSLDASYGGSGWFFYEGHVNRQSISGHGDVFVTMGCEEPNHPNVLCEQTIERRWAAVDNCGNAAYHTQIITVDDNTAPVFSNCPANVTVQCAADEPAMVDPSTLVATDNCDGPVTVSLLSSDTTGTIPCNYTITYTYEASDVCDNRNSCSYSVTVYDDVDPVIAAPFDYTVECNEDVFFEAATATDNCSSSVNVAETVDTAVVGCVITYTRTFYAMDDCGNESSSAQTITVRDTTNPILEIPANDNFECLDEVVFEAASASDNCTDDLTIIETVDTLNNGIDCEYTITRSFSVSDDCGNTTIGVQTIHVKDVTNPSFTNLAGPYYIECDEVYSAEWTNPAASDNCDDELTYTYADTTGSGGCYGTIHRTVTVRDNCGNSATQTFVIYIVDTTAPVIVSIPADLTVECSAGPMVPNTNDVVATDNCGDASGLTAYSVYAEGGNNHVDISVEVDTTFGQCQGSYTITWTWTATDFCGNEATAVTTITVVDTTAPEFISTPQNITIDCSQELPAVDIVIATDNCTSTPIVAIASDVIVPGNCANNYTVERTYVATDDCDNSAEFVQYIYVEDQVDPIFNAENESIYNYECGTTIPVIQPIAVDNCDEELEYSFVDATSGTACNQVITRTWTAADDCGRTSSFVQTININDTQAPQIFADLEISRPCSDWTTLDPNVYATDNCSNNVQVTVLSDEMVSGGCAGHVIRTLIAADDCGNVDTVEQVITLFDNFAPVAISEPVTITVECSDEIPAYQPAWSDNCSGTWTESVTVEYNGVGCSLQIVETYSATDPCGNTGYTTRTINVVDTTNPVLIGVPENITIDCNDAVPAAGGVTATDNCDIDVTVTVEEVTSAGNCAQNYTIERTFRATDDCGNQSVQTQVINIVDNTAPIFNADNESIFNYTCPEVSIGQPAPVVTPEAVEDCGQVSLTYSDVETGSACNRSIVRTWVAADNCGNASTFVQNITISDLEGPVFAGPNNVSAPCDNYAGIIDVTATDNCSGVVEVVIAGESISGSGCARVVTRTYSATDGCGNTSTFVQTIQLTDDVAPTVTNPPVAVTRDCNQSIPVYTPQWTDNCDASLTTEFDETAFTIGCTTVITRMYTATDDCGNATTVNYVVTLVDTTAPTASNVTPNFTAECSQFGGVASVADPVFTDNCGSPISVVETSSEVASGCDRIITITWTATDQCGNARTVSTVVTLEDNSNPTFTFVPAGGTFSCEQGIDFGQATATDACNAVTITSSDTPSAVCENSYTITRTWVATDACGNSSNAFTVYNVVDETAPYFVSVPTDLVLGCNVELADLPVTTATAADNCDGSVDVTYADVLVSSDNCTRQYLRTFTATDNCGNTETATQVITSSDNEAPVFAGAADIDVICADFTEDGVYVTASDNCGTASITVFGGDLELSSNDCRTIQRQYVAIDNCGNDSYFIQIIHIIDTEAPVANEVEAAVEYSCNEEWTPATVTFTDNCDVDLTVDSNVQTTDLGCTVIHAYSWTATDACGNSTTVSQLVTIVDDIAPVIADASSEQTVACNEVVEFSTPTATDLCAGVVPVTVAVSTVEGNCLRTVTTTFRAEDGCGNSSEVSHIVHYVDEVGPVWSAGNQVNFTYECGTTPAVSQPIATDNCNSITYSYVDGDSFAVGVGCLTGFNRTWTAQDACGNNSVAFVQTITFVDTTDPVLSGCPSDLVLDCTAEVPAAPVVTATDNCDANVTVEFTETTEGTVTNGSNLYTPVRPASNPCNYPYDWAMALFSMPSQYRWYQLDQSTPATMVDNGDGSLTISGRMFNVLRPDGGFDFNVTYAEGLNWAAWSALSNPNGFKADCGGEAANHPSWMYYILQSSSAAELTGWGRFAGSSIHLTHAPSNEYFGFQVGDGANNYNGDNGAGGWFLYGGAGDIFLENGNEIQLFSGSGPVPSQGIGDFAFRVEDCPGYSIIRTWTAVDCEGNESSCTQTITFASLDNNVAEMDMTTENNDGDRSAEIAIVGIMPNPATDRSQISFMSTVDGKLSLQVLDMTGRVVGDLFNNQAVAGQVYTAEFDANVMSSGIYMVRLSSGTAFQMERLLIQK
jgi:hypothetical protein